MRIWKTCSLRRLLKLPNKLRWKILPYVADNEVLWRRVHSRFQINDDGTLKPGFFRDINGVSCDIAVYSTVKSSLRGYDDTPRPQGSGLAEFLVSAARKIAVVPNTIDVNHDPQKYPNGKRNYAHSLLVKNAGQLTTGESKKLTRKVRYKVVPDVTAIRWG